VPIGRIHAADLNSTTTLCGIPLADLAEFGRSRYPFEHFSQGKRCPVCNRAAGYPSE
jgi:hypothetical protein